MAPRKKKAASFKRQRPGKLIQFWVPVPMWELIQDAATHESRTVADLCRLLAVKAAVSRNKKRLP